jgi:hypothetical protein
VRTGRDAKRQEHPAAAALLRVRLLAKIPSVRYRAVSPKLDSDWPASSRRKRRSLSAPMVIRFPWSAVPEMPAGSAVPEMPAGSAVPEMPAGSVSLGKLVT